ncbi:hypothetical protein D3C86_1790190 [compost metagenome]
MAISLKVSLSSLALIHFIASSGCFEDFGINVSRSKPPLIPRPACPFLPFRAGTYAYLASGKFLVKASAMPGMSYHGSGITPTRPLVNFSFSVASLFTANSLSSSPCLYRSDI